jgi:4-hydroxy-tetrahydrodipicolinate synthase
MSTLNLQGAYTALVTPFTADGSAIDYDAFEAHVVAQLAGKISGLVPCGTTGETPTLTDEEQKELVERTVQIVKGKVPVLAGTGANSTAKTIKTSLAALEAGADAVMVVTPYYNKPSQDGMHAHFRAVASAVAAPIVIYNIPGRCVVDLTVDTLLRILHDCPNVVGVKDASGNVCYCQDLLRRAGDRVAVMCGDDPLTLPMMSVGAKGVISVTSNVYPAEVAACVADVLAGKWAEARKRHLRLFPVHRALFVEPNPQPTKAALFAKGRMTAAVRLPLIEASGRTREELARVMKEFEGT